MIKILLGCAFLTLPFVMWCGLLVYLFGINILLLIGAVATIFILSKMFKAIARILME